MPTPPRYFVWLWLDSAGQPKYLGKAHRAGAEHPADVMWANRFRMNSPLGHWLQSLDSQPQRSVELISRPIYDADAMALYAQEIDRLKRRGLTLLSSRPFGTKVGGGYNRAVMDPAGDVFVSVRAAAEDYGLNPATITRRCQDPRSNWRYV